MFHGATTSDARIMFVWFAKAGLVEHALQKLPTSRTILGKVRLDREPVWPRWTGGPGQKLKCRLPKYLTFYITAMNRHKNELINDHSYYYHVYPLKYERFKWRNVDTNHWIHQSSSCRWIKHYSPLCLEVNYEKTFDTPETYHWRVNLLLYMMTYCF